jgi:hypothetical protein
VQSLEDLVAACSIDLSVWEPDVVKIKSYQMSYKPPATREGDEKQWTRMHHRDSAELVQMYSVAATFKRKVAIVDARAEIEALIEEAQTRIVRTPLVIVKPSDTGYMMSLNIADPHVGKLAWGRETGGPNYDVAIARETYNTAVEVLLQRSSHISATRILYVVGNDGLHVDGNSNTTTKGTPQDMDGRYFRSFQTYRQMITDNAEMMARHYAPVTIVGVKGNHDRQTSMTLMDSVRSWFRDNKWIAVDAEPLDRKYFRFGRVLLGYTHGDQIKADKLARTMAIEEPELWAGSIHREIHTGHLHTERVLVDEVAGVKIRVIPSLAPPDAWHAAAGYVGNLQTAIAYHFHESEGLVGTAGYNHVPPPEQRAEKSPLRLVA